MELQEKYKTSEEPELRVYKASAGSGKTFTLAVEYISLLVLNPRAYRQILAVTFTNKATSEMKERILSQLYGIRQGDSGSEAYLQEVIKNTGMSSEEVRKAAGVALDYMLHDYSRFRVETIDSFFQSVMRNLARELDLSPNLNVELNGVEVISDAVDRMIEKLEASSPVLAWLLDYINERIADDKRWNVSNELKSFGNNIFNELYIEKGKTLREKMIANPALIRHYRNGLMELKEQVFDQMKGFYDQFIGILEQEGLTPEDLKNGKRGVAGYFNKLNQGDLDDKIFNATAEKCMNSAEEWSTKKSPDLATIIHLAETCLMDLLKEAENMRVKNNRILNSCTLSLQHLNKVGLLTNIDEEVRLLNHEHNRFLLSDTNALLHQLIGSNDSSFIYEKIGTNIQNIMIDEFQDTSRMQWRNFQLLLLEGLSQGADSLIVGDVKQSIYRWRNGDWGILNGLKDHIGQFPIHEKKLETNRRSEANIICFNNTLFHSAVEYLNDQYGNDHDGRQCEDLSNAYADITQISPKKQQEGYVKVSFLDTKDDSGNDYTEITLQAMGAEVKRLLESGVKLDDIAILVRKNKSIPAIADYFDKNLNCRIVSDEAFRLDASLVIRMLILALRVLTDGKNEIAKAMLAVDYNRYVLGKDGNLDMLLTDNLDRLLPEEFTGRQEELRLLPLYELLEELFRLFDMQKIENQDAYLFSFYDFVTEYLQNSSSELDAFLKYWEETLSSKTIPSGEVEGIRIFSIHKSKGLEFHTVLLPFCDWKMENETNNQLVWCAPSLPPYDELDLVPVNYSSKMAQSIYKNDYEKEKLQLWVDNLNLLYVAFTRAGKNLIVWSKKGQSGTMSELLANSLPSIIPDCTNATWDEDVFEFGNVCPSVYKQEEQETNKLLVRPERCPVKMESVQHEIEFRQSNRSADFIAGVDEENSPNRYINRGKLLHTLFSGIATFEDVDTAVDQLVFEGVIDSEQQEEEIRDFAHHALEQPSVCDWYAGGWELFSECTILYRENGLLQTRRPDRVMKRGNEVVVVDFKFAHPDKRYNRQVAEYVRLLQNMGYPDVKGYLWYVDEERVEAV